MNRREEEIHNIDGASLASESLTPEDLFANVLPVEDIPNGGYRVEAFVLGTAGDLLAQLQIAMAGLESGHFKNITIYTGKDTPGEYELTGNITERISDESRINIVQCGPETIDIVKAFSAGDIDPAEALSKLVQTASDFKAAREVEINNGKGEPDLCLASTAASWFVDSQYPMVITDPAPVLDPAISDFYGSAVLAPEGILPQFPTLGRMIGTLLHNNKLGRKLSHKALIPGLKPHLVKPIKEILGEDIVMDPAKRDNILARVYLTELKPLDQLVKMNQQIRSKKGGENVIFLNRLNSSTIEGLSQDEDDFFARSADDDNTVITFNPGGSMDITDQEKMAERLIAELNSREKISLFIVNPKNTPFDGGYSELLKQHPRVHVSVGPVDLPAVLSRSNGLFGHAGSGTITSGVEAGIPVYPVPRFHEQKSAARQLHCIGLGPSDPVGHSEYLDHLSDIFDFLLEHNVDNSSVAEIPLGKDFLPHLIKHLVGLMVQRKRKKQ